MYKFPLKTVILLSFFVLLCVFHVSFAAKESGAEKLQALKNFEKWFFEKVDESFGVKKEEKEKAPKRKFKLGLIPGSTEAGIFATQDINADEELFKIPSNLILSKERILQATSIGPLLKQTPEVSLKEEEVIALYLIYIKYCAVGEVNPWELWLRALPKTVNSILYFTEEEILLLKGLNLYDEAVAFRTETQKKFKEIEEKIIIKNPTIFKCALSYVSWKWAISIVRSRSIRLLDVNGSPFLAIVPYFDFFNHKSFQEEKFSWGFKAANKFFHAEAHDAIKKGEEIFQSYGQYSNSRLLLDYGFVEEDNPYNSVLVDNSYFGIDPQDVVHDWKLEKILEWREDKKSRLLLTRTGMSHELYQAALIANSDVEDFDENGNMAKEPNIYTQLNIARWFQAISQSKLEKYPNKIEEDYELIKSEGWKKLSKKSQLAIQLRLSEKEILQQIRVSFANRMNKILQSIKETSNEKQEL